MVKATFYGIAFGVCITIQNASGQSIRGLGSVVGVDSVERNLASKAWVSCAQQGDRCDVPKDKVIMARFRSKANPSRSAYTKAYNILICEPSFFRMDPDAGEDKECSYVVLEDESRDHHKGFEKFADEGKSGPDKVKKAGMYEVKYGKETGPFLYAYQGSDGEKLFRFPCGRFLDIDEDEQKNCYIREVTTDLLDGNEWTECATENSACHIPDELQAGTLFRFGHEFPNFTKYTYSLYSGTGSLPCDLTTTGGYDPAIDQLKRCSYISTKRFTGIPTGHWRHISSAKSHVNQSSVSITVSTSEGFTSTSTESKTETWQESLSQTIGSKLAFEGVGEVSSSVTIETSHSIAKQMSVATSHSVQNGHAVECTAAGNPNKPFTVYMWQWVVALQEKSQIVDSQQFEVSSLDVRCTTSAKPPSCPLTMKCPNGSKYC
eukprot:CAMPEP_0203759366 /NCGR_PEP_ID=MMETSP0098-20131031/12337_1 /ASSEMBLY_ACC=CAM_ASM_000208 /TAXON_ID=96639 /ORGANISM=" , Strain NY0313808BC1" /LENGTH=432 /DNA_ID=CAMNT_0050652243 /DNA_START=134 /DNA_END=1429 /DNA_ORIENTATION=-